jgi:hypothetical protein
MRGRTHRFNCGGKWPVIGSRFTHNAKVFSMSRGVSTEEEDLRPYKWMVTFSNGTKLTLWATYEQVEVRAQRLADRLKGPFDQRIEPHEWVRM